MKNKRLIWILSFISVGIGVVCMVIAWSLGGTPGFYFDRTGFHSANDALEDTVMKGEEELEEFESIEVEVRDADLEIAVTDRFAIAYCVDGSLGKPALTVKNGKLSFREQEEGHFWVVGGFGSVGSKREQKYYVKIEIPEGTFLADVTLDAENAKVVLPSLDAERVSLKNEYGDIKMGDLKGRQFKSHSEDGRLSAGKLSVDEAEIENDYGAVEIEAVDGKQLKADLENADFAVGELKIEQAELENEYGDIEISHASGGKLAAKLEDGDLAIGELELSDLIAECEYGSAELGLAKAAGEYSLDLKTEYGRIELPDGDVRNTDGDGMQYQSRNDASYKITVRCEDGDIILHE